MTLSLPFKAAGADMVVQTMVEPGPWQRVRLARHLGPVPYNVLSRIQKIPEVERVSGQLHLWSWWQPKMIAVAGVDPANPDIGPIASSPQRATKSTYFAVSRRALRPNDRYAAFVDKRFAEKLGLKIGSEIPLGGAKFQIVGLGDFQGVTRVAQAEIFIPLQVAWDLAGKGEVINFILVRLRNAQYITRATKAIQDIVIRATGLEPNAVRVFTSSTVLPEITGLSPGSSKSRFR